MSPLEIRPARPEDKTAVTALSAHIWEGEDYVPDTFDDWMADRHGQFSLAYDAHELQGFAKLSRLGPGEWWLEGLRVHPGRRGQGIARRLHHHMLELADHQGSGILRFATNAQNEAVHHLAESTGFRRIAGYTGARISTGPPGTRPEALCRATPADQEAIRQWLGDSAYFAAAHGLYEEHWTWLALAPRLDSLLASGLVHWWQPDNRPLGLVILDPGSGEQETEKPLRLSYLDVAYADLPSLTTALRALAATRALPDVASRPLATPEVRAAYLAAGWEVKEYELSIFERPLQGRAQPVIESIENDKEKG